MIPRCNRTRRECDKDRDSTCDATQCNSRRRYRRRYSRCSHKLEHVAWSGSNGIDRRRGVESPSVPARPLNRDRWLRKPVAGAPPPAFGVISRESYRAAPERMINGAKGRRARICPSSWPKMRNCTDERNARFTRTDRHADAARGTIMRHEYSRTLTLDPLKSFVCSTQKSGISDLFRVYPVNIESAVGKANHLYNVK